MESYEPKAEGNGVEPKDLADAAVRTPAGGGRMRDQLMRLVLIVAMAVLAGGCGGGPSPSASGNATSPPVPVDANDTTPDAFNPAVEEEQFSGECWAVQIQHYFQYAAAPDELVSSWPGEPCEGCMVSDLREGSQSAACSICEHAIRVDCTIRSMSFPGAWDDVACRVGEDRIGITHAVTDGFWLVVDEQRIDASGTAIEVDAHVGANTVLGLFEIAFDLSLERISEIVILGGGMSDQGPLRVHGVRLAVQGDEGDLSGCAPGSPPDAVLHTDRTAELLDGAAS